jgi:DNA-binding CsgD family transcriptional regulator
VARSSPIDIVEAAYRVGHAREVWLRGVLDATGPVIQPSTFACGYFVDISEAGAVRVDGVSVLGGSASLAKAIAAFHETTPDMSRIVHAQAAMGAVTVSELLAKFEYARPGFEKLGASVAHAGIPLADTLGVVGLDAAGRGVVLSCAYDRPTTLNRQMRTRWTRVGVHLAAGERLRRALEARPSEAEAVLSPAGRVEHAEGDAKGSAALESLRTRVAMIDRARSRRGRSDPDAALEAWRGLVAGRWSLVDRFESDGRRYVVAHRNEPVPAKVLALTLRERQVVAHRVVGHASKVIAYALGISAAAVSAALRSAMLKLGARNVQQLLTRLDRRVVNAAARDRP